MTYSSTQLLELLESCGFDDAGVNDATERVLDLVRSEPAASDRMTMPAHLTGSAFVMNATGTAGVLMFHTKLGRWLQPGGHADGSFDLAQVALREATEETGMANLWVDPQPIDVDIHKVRPPNEEPHFHFDVRFLVVASSVTELRPNHESTEMHWVERSKFANFTTEESVTRLADSAFERFQSTLKSDL